MLKELLEKIFSSLLSYHCFSLECMISKQQAAIKRSIVDANSHIDGIFLSFDLLNTEFYLENRLIDSFSSHFSFYKADCSLEESKSHHFSHLDNIVLNASSDLSTVVVVSDTSIKNNIAMLITHIHSFNSSLKKTLYHTINITTMEAELFAIRYRINQAIQISGTSCIIIITDALHAVQ